MTIPYFRYRVQLTHYSKQIHVENGVFVGSERELLATVFAHLAASLAAESALHSHSGVDMLAPSSAQQFRLELEIVNARIV